MTENATQRLTEALRLSESDRSELAVELIESLDPATDDAAELEWDQEIQKRVEQIRDGQAKLVPWEEARRMILIDIYAD